MLDLRRVAKICNRIQREILEQLKLGFKLIEIGKNFRRYVNNKNRNPIYRLIMDSVKNDPTDTFEVKADEDDGFAQGYDPDYTTAHDTCYNYGSTSLYIGQFYDGTNYLVRRSFLKFDTSIIAPDASISSAKLRLYLESDHSTNDFTFRLQIWTGDTPIDCGDYNQFDGVNYDDGNFGSADLVSGYNEITISNYDLITKGGYTKICVRSSRDIDSTVPTTDEYVLFYSHEQGAGYIPQLEVTYSAAQLSLSQPISISPIKTKAGVKVKSQFISVYTTYTITVPPTKVLSQLISVSTFPLKYSETIHKQPVSALTTYMLQFQKPQTQPIEVTTTLPFKRFEAIHLQPLSILTTKIAKSQYHREYAQIISAFTSVTAVKEIIRLLTEYVSVMDLLLPKQVEALRTQTIAVLSFPSTILSLIYTQPISVNTFLFKENQKIREETVSVKDLLLPKKIRKATAQSISILEIYERIVNYQRFLSQSVSVLTSSTSILQLVRFLTQPVTVDVSLVKAASKLRPEAISVLTLPTTISQVIRLFTQPVAVTSLPFKSSTKITLQPIGVLDTKTILNQFQRVKLQSITAVPALTRVWQATRAFTQPITVLATPTAVYTILRALTQPVSVLSTITKSVEKSVTEVVKTCVLELVYVPELGRYALIIDNEFGLLT